MRTLLASLTDHPIAFLRGIAELRGIELASNHRDDAAVQLAALLAEPAATAAALAACSLAAQAAWAALAATAGRMKAAVFGRAHGAFRPIGPGRLEREQLWRAPGSPAEELWYRGLIFRAFADQGDGPAEYVYIPPELLSAATPAPPPVPSAADLPVIPAPAQPGRMLNALAVDLCAALAALRETPARLTAAGQIAAADVARLADGLLLADPLRLDLLLALARGRGWLKPDRERLVVDVSAVTAWLRAAHWEQVRGLLNAWRESGDPLWNDLRRVPGLRAEGEWRNDPLLARRGLLDLLGNLPENGWHRLDDLVAWMRTHKPDFQRPDGNYTLWYIRDTATDRYLSGFESWEQVEGRLLRFLVTGPLFWLGAVELGIGDGGLGTEQSPIPNPPMVFRLTPIGAAWLRGRLPTEPLRPGRLTIGEDFVVTAPLLLPLIDRFRLLRFTEPITAQTAGAAGDRKDPPTAPDSTRHRITRGSLARARAGGIKGQAVLEFLRRTAGGRIPPRVEAALSRWDQHGGAVRITRGAVLRVADAAVLAALRSDPALAPLLGDLLSAQAAVVSEANLPKVLRALEEMGYGVKVE